MKTKNKLTAVLLAVFMLISVLPVNVVFASEITAITISPEQLILPADYEGEALLNYRWTDSGADSSGIVFSSSNENVATVDNNGYVTPLAEGETVITASYGNVVSNECVVTVTAAGNYTGNNLLNLPSVSTSRIDVNKYLSWPEKYGDVQIALWKGNKTGAFSFTADDCITGDFPQWNAWREAYGISTTFFTPIVGAFDKAANKAALQEQVNLGQDVQSHTKYHKTGDEQKAQTSAERIDELNTSKLAINELENHKSKTIGYAYGFYDPEMAKNFYIAGRTGIGFLNTADKVDYMAVNSLSMTPTMPLRYTKPNSASMEAAVGSLLDSEYKFWNTGYYGGWTNTHSHALASSKQTHSELGANTTVLDVWNFTFKNYLIPNKDRVYMDNFTNVSMYGQERDSATVEVSQATADSIKFNITDTLSDEYFDFPLTLKVKLDSTWTSLTATQNDIAIEAELVKNGGNVFAVVEAVPDGGEVVLSRSGAEKVFSSDASLSGITYSTDGVTDTAVSDFNADKTQYTISLPAGTTDAYIYASGNDENAIVRVNPMMSRLDVSGGSAAATITVTAEDESVNTYTVNFEVDGFDDITALDINTPENLNQEDTTEAVEFVVTPTPAENISEETIEWYVDGIKQDGKTGTSFSFTPAAAGSYEIYAVAGDVVSDTRTVTLVLTGAVADKVFLKEKFNSDGYVAGSKVPGGAGYKWTGSNNSFVVGTDSVHGNIGVFKSGTSAQNITVYTSAIDSESKPVVFSAKVKMDASAETGHSFSMMFRPPTGSTVTLGGLGGNKYHQTTIGSSWGNPTWVSGEWINIIGYLEPNSSDMTACNATLYVGGTFAGGTTAQQAAKFAKRSTTVDMSAFTMSSINTLIRCDLPANGYDVSVADIKIYQPNSFIMSLEKTADVALDESVKVKFNHHMDLTTFSQDLIKVTANGKEAEIENISVDPLYPDYMIIDFADGALKAGTQYTVSVDSSIKDIAGSSVYEAKSFTTAGSTVIKPKLKSLVYSEDDGNTKNVTGFDENDNSETYSVILSYGTKSATVSAVAADENSEILYSPENGSADVSDGSGSVTVTVTDKDSGEKNVYTVNFEVTTESVVSNVLVPDEYNTGHISNFDDLVEITQKYPSLIKDETGSVRITESGTYEGFKLEGGGLYITGADVVLKDFYIDASLQSGIDFRGESLVAENGTVKNASNGVVSATDTTLKKLHIYDMSDDCVRVEKNALIEGCYLHNAGKNDSTAHADGIQVTGSGEGGKIEIINNRIDIQAIPETYYATSALMIKADMGNIDDIIIEGNVLNGGTYTVYLLDAAYLLTNAVMKNNLIANGAVYGNLSYDCTSAQIYNNTIIEDVLSGSVIIKDENGNILDKLSDAKGKNVTFAVNVSNYALSEKQGKITVSLIKNSETELESEAEFTLPTYIPYNEYKDLTAENYAQPLDKLFGASIDIPSDLSGYSVSVSVTSGSTLICEKVFEVDSSAPEAPVATMDKITKTSASVLWSASKDNVGTVGYKIYLNDVFCADVVDVCSYTFEGLTEKTGYTAKIIAYDAEGNESEAASVAFKTQGDVVYDYELIFEDSFDEGYSEGTISGTTGSNPLKSGWYSVGGAGDWSIVKDGTNLVAKVSPYSQAYPSMWKIVPIEVGKPIVFSGKVLLHDSNMYYMRPRYVSSSGVGTAVDGFNLYANGTVSMYGAGKYAGEEKVLADKWISYEFYILPGDSGEESELKLTLSGEGVVDGEGNETTITMGHSAVLDVLGMAENKQLLMIYNNNFAKTGSDVTAYNLLDDVKIYTPATESEIASSKICASISGDGYITVNGENKGSSFTSEYGIGEVLSVNAQIGENEAFMYWQDLESGRILTYSTEYTFTVGTDKNIIAVTADSSEETKFISFISLNGEVLLAGAYNSDMEVPHSPYVYGYKFEGWYSGGIKADFAVGDRIPQISENTYYRAGFTKSEASYTVSVTGAVEAGGVYEYNEEVILTAADSETFAYWKKDGKIVSYNSVYSFYVTGDAEVEVVYNETAPETAVVVMSTPVIVEENRIAFFAERSILSEYTVVEAGILLSDKSNVNLDNYKYKSTSVYNSNNGQFTVRKANVSSGETWYGVAYVIYTDGENVYTLYSNEVSKTM